ncbi:hypothetical protein KIW84_042336 [Lathyrus oleraceus]|uniref:DUF223 domain-containing protein n=1 Tax=Pisum sativum TaxID=3888 RepID=A0A9D5AMK0_PEA|nr:hypothetical protein KIW84_042336 [Pisum sativum]
MSRKVDSVKDINDSKETWRLAVRIMDVWSVVNNKGIEHLEMIVMDSLNQSKTEYAKLVPNKENLETSAGEEVDFEASGATQLSSTKPSKKLKIESSS